METFPRKLFLVDLLGLHKSLSLSTHSAQDSAVYASICLPVYGNWTMLYTLVSRGAVPFGLHPIMTRDI